MTTIDNAAIARQLGYSRDEMIAKFGNPGEKTPTEIGSLLGLDSSTITSIFGDSSQGDTFTSSSSVAQEADDEVVNYANYWGVSYETARAALKAEFGDPEGYEGADEDTTSTTNSSSTSVAQNADDEVVNYANYWGVSYEAAREALKNQFGDPTGYEGADSTSTSSSNPFAEPTTAQQYADNDVLEYAMHYGVSISAAREALRNQYGNP